MSGGTSSNTVHQVRPLNAASPQLGSGLFSFLCDFIFAFLESIFPLGTCIAQLLMRNGLAKPLAYQPTSHTPCPVIRNCWLGFFLNKIRYDQTIITQETLLLTHFILILIRFAKKLDNGFPNNFKFFS